jgi:hypothetical protein
VFFLGFNRTGKSSACWVRRVTNHMSPEETAGAVIGRYHLLQNVPTLQQLLVESLTLRSTNNKPFPHIAARLAGPAA